MAAPTFVTEAETEWNGQTITGVQTTASVSLNANDRLVAYAFTETHGSTLSISNDGAALTWTLQQSILLTDYTQAYVWTATMDTTRSITFTITRSLTPQHFYGMNVLAFRSSDGIGASAQANAASGAPSLNITTTQADSAIVVANGDWNALDGASRVWRTGAGAFTEQTYFRDSLRYTVYGGYHANAGAVGTKTVGLSAPTGQKYALLAVEVKGTPDAVTGLPLLVMPPMRATRR